MPCNARQGSWIEVARKATCIRLDQHIDNTGKKGGGPSYHPAVYSLEWGIWAESGLEGLERLFLRAQRS